MDHTEMGSYRKRPLGNENGAFHQNSVDYGSAIDSDDGMDQMDDIKLNYRDFGTIDWFRELALDQKRHRKLKGPVWDCLMFYRALIAQLTDTVGVARGELEE